MKISTIFKKISNIKFIPIFFWLIVWQIASLVIDQEILLVSPFSAIKRLVELSFEGYFWMSVFNSWMKILLGFVLAFIIGFLLAYLSSTVEIIRNFLEIPINVIQAVPVVSFIILCLIWIDSKNLSIFISFLMALPIIYRNISSGILNIPKELTDVVKVFDVGIYRKFRYIYVSELYPSIKSSIKIAFGLCFKAGIAAEVIGLPKNTMGEYLYNSKVYLNTSDLFAWTIVIVVISIVFQKLIIKAVDIVFKKLEI